MSNSYQSPDEFMAAFKKRLDARPMNPVREKKFEIKRSEVVFEAKLPPVEWKRPAPLPDIHCGCGDPSLEYRSRSASKAKCGWNEYGFVSSPPKKYLNATLIGDLFRTDECEIEPPSEFEVESTQWDLECHGDYNIDTCVLSVTSSGGFFQTYCDDHVTHTDVFCSSTSFTSCDVVDSATQCRVFGTGSDSDKTLYTKTLSNEYTTALLKTKTTDAFPAFPDWGIGSSSSFASLSANELNYSAREAEVRINHNGPCYLKVWLRTVFSPADDPENVEYADLATYEYTGAAEGDHTSSAYTIPVPSDNGTTTVEMKFICVEGEAEPAWP